jgi:hypothetical protein
VKIGGDQGGPVYYVSSDPDGVLTAQRGTLAIDTTTGIAWKNRNGATRWDPVIIPPIYGRSGFLDFDDGNFASVTVGTGTSLYSAAPAGRMGIRRVTGAAVGDAGLVYAANNGALCFGSGRVVFRAAVNVLQLSDATDRFAVRVGMGDSGTAAASLDGIWLECDLATNGSNNWFLAASTNSVITRVDTGIAPVANVFSNIEIRVNAAGSSAAAEIDGVAGAAAVTTNIPISTSRVLAPMHAMIAKTLGASTRWLDIDWLSYDYLLSSPRGL